MHSALMIYLNQRNLNKLIYVIFIYNSNYKMKMKKIDIYGSDSLYAFFGLKKNY